MRPPNPTCGQCGPAEPNWSLNLNQLMMKLQTRPHGAEFPLVSEEVVGSFTGPCAFLCGVLCVPLSPLQDLLLIPHWANSGLYANFYK